MTSGAMGCAGGMRRGNMVRQLSATVAPMRPRKRRKHYTADGSVGAAKHREEKSVMIDATYLKAHRTATSMAAKKGGVVA